MRFKEIINEAGFVPSETPLHNVDEIVAYIKKHCQPWLTQTKNGEHQVYRGVKEHLMSPGFVKTVRDARKPKDTDKRRHKMFNALIAAAGGIANRSNSLFCTGSFDDANTYGTVFVVYPVGSFNYTWSPFFQDWTKSLDLGEIEKFVKEVDPAKNYKTHTNYNEYLRKLEADLSDPTKVDKDKLHNDIIVNRGLIPAIENESEIMIQCAAAVYVPYFTNDEIEDAL